MKKKKGEMMRSETVINSDIERRGKQLERFHTELKTAESAAVKSKAALDGVLLAARGDGDKAAIAALERHRLEHRSAVEEVEELTVAIERCEAELKILDKQLDQSQHARRVARIKKLHLARRAQGCEIPG